MDRAQQIKEAEELLGHQHIDSFAKGLFYGRVIDSLGAPYPTPSPEDQKKLDDFLARVRQFLQTRVDPVRIDRESNIPRDVIDGLFDLGVMSMSIQPEYGGLGFSQYAYCKVIEEIGAVDASMAILVNAHQSIGIKSLLLFGTPEQQKKWLPKLIQGKMLAAFALTEPNAGSDAGGLETRAILNAAGTHYVINGQKQWITNGGIAGLLTVMAKVPNDPGETGRERITAFLVTPDMKGFQVDEKALDKCGIRGTATSKLSFHDLHVPVENIIGQPKKGLRVALTLLDFGRTTFGAACTGAAKFCVRHAYQHAATRHQFGKPLAHFELVKKKLAEMSALAFAMESGTYFTASLIDRKMGEFMIETAMLKVFASENLWQIVNDTIQIFGGRGYFTDHPFERMMRDARINMIGEGANDVMRTFIALVGMRDIGLEMKGIIEFGKSPSAALKNLLNFVKRHLPGSTPHPPNVHLDLWDLAHGLGSLTHKFGRTVEGQMMRHKEEILEKQHIQARIADIATELYMMSATLYRMDRILSAPDASSDESQRLIETGRYYHLMASQRIHDHLARMSENFDKETNHLADSWLKAPPS